jgi:DNA-binding winged helix-turn-helix (wHTH) protein/TolB-like protein
VFSAIVFNPMESGRVRFGLFEFDAATQELRREGVLVRLQSQPAQVLNCLIERAGQVVTRDELCKAVWGNETFVDFDGGLNFCISQIRSALRDESAAPTYIRTIPKSGYQFIAPIERLSERTPTEPGIPAATHGRVNARVAALAITVCVIATLIFMAGFWFRSRQHSKYSPIVAVLRFDNETGDSGVTRFSDGLTDNVVEQLTSLSNGRYSVIGNAQVLRRPRDQRDLNEVASSLHAAYVVLGQVQSNSGQTRVLAHLIRLPDQTHIWVARMDRAAVNLDVESEIAHKIAAEFSPRVMAEARSDASPQAAKH